MTTRRVCRRHIGVTVANHDAAVKINLMSACQIKDHPRLWLAAGTIPHGRINSVGMMRAESNIHNLATFCRYAVQHMSMKTMNGGLIKIAKPYAALIGDNKNGDAGLMGKLDRFGSIWHKVKIFHPIRVAMINVNNTITIQKRAGRGSGITLN